MDNRLDAIRSWLLQVLPEGSFDVVAASQDASFRRYFRVCPADGRSLIVMDAPPTHENNNRFVFVAKLLRKIGVNVPEVLETDFQRGFLLLSDLGKTHYLAVLARNPNKHQVDRLYNDAMDALLTIQSLAACDRIPEYSHELLDAEMALFRDWFLGRHLGIRITETLHRTLRSSFDFLQCAATEQPQVFVHRDYHSRNLMVREQYNPGILDFQDAVRGPITYDLVSLLKDVYISWPRTRVDEWVLGYRKLAIARGILHNVDATTWLRWFDLMGAQRHLKIAGIFARLYHRDGKPGYLADIPLTLDYLAQVCARYPELAALGTLLDDLPSVGNFSPRH
ncbi:MAG: phosphotransferase [Gammaproteobacteria bacterium]|nr:phosphotransferase [Gammaproteobacteria bacterium]NNJ83759.1 phosphotransferase [Gammaproteobacteria bacterium]